MGMNAADLALVVAEIAPKIRGGVVQRVDQPDERAICLAVRRPGATLRLLCSASPTHARMHLVPHRVRGDALRGFGQFLRKHLEGARIVSLRQAPNDRVVHMVAEGSERIARLVFELIGPHANVVAVDGEGRIAEALRHVHGARRSILPGAPYEPPAGSGRIAEPDPGAVVAASPSAYFAELYERLEAEAAFEARRNAVRRGLADLGRGLERRLRSSRAALQAGPRAETLRRHADLLKANLYRIPEKAEMITVADGFQEGAPEVTIKLNPRESPQASMQGLYRRGKKLERRAALAARRADEARQGLAQLDALRQRLEDAASGEDLAVAEAALAAVAGRKEPQKPESGGAGARGFVSADGWDILVGRSARENDRLTQSFAHANDLWLHVRGASGSHVVVPVARGKTVPADTLVDAATLAAFYSDARGRPRVEVDYTPVKYVRKPRKAPAGTVVLTQHKTLGLRVEQARLDRLLKR